MSDPEETDSMEPFLKFIAFTMHTLPEVQRIPFLEQVSTALVKRSVNTGSIDDLDRAIFMKECIWERTEDEHPNYLIYVESFCYALSERYDKTKSLDDLNRAITLQNILLTPSLAPEEGSITCARHYTSALTGMTRSTISIKRFLSWMKWLLLRLVMTILYFSFQLPADTLCPKRIKEGYRPRYCYRSTSGCIPVAR
jgi:hypothetical protein